MIFRHLLIIVCLLLSIFSVSFGELLTYPTPTGVPISIKYTVLVRQAAGSWQSVPVYDFFDQHTYNNALTAETHIAIFDATGDIEVQVQVASSWLTVANAVLRPQIRNTAIVQNGNTLFFHISDSTRSSIVEINGNSTFPLAIFCNPIDKNPPATGPGKMALAHNGIYYGPGIYNEDITMVGDSNTTIYIAGGAVVRGTLTLTNTQNVTICGSGMIYKSHDTPAGVPFKIDNTTGLQIRNICVTSGDENWTCWIHGSNHISAVNFRVVGEVRDGFDIINSQYVTALNCYFQSHDDVTCCKGMQWARSKPVAHILFQNCTMNNIAGGFGLCRIGAESNAPSMSDIKFRNCDVIHNLPSDDHQEYWKQGIVEIHSFTADSCAYSNILLDNIRVEDCQDDYLFRLWSERTGSIDTVTFRNVNVLNNTYKGSHITGDATFPISNLNFDGLFNGNGQITSASQGSIAVTGATNNITFKTGEQFTDDFTDWQKVFAKSSNWRLVTAQNLDYDCDNSFAQGTSATEEFLIYKYASLSEFVTRVYFKQGMDPTIRFYGSADNMVYTELPVVQSSSWNESNGWQGASYWPAQAALTNINYLKIVVGSGASIIPSPLIGSITLSRPGIASSTTSNPAHLSGHFKQRRVGQSVFSVAGKQLVGHKHRSAQVIVSGQSTLQIQFRSHAN